MITLARARNLIAYDPNDGSFRWKLNHGGQREGCIAGSLRRDGYVAIKMDGRQYLAHRLAFLFLAGRWPDDKIDHINGNRADNRAENIRQASQADNCQNRALRSDSATGLVGVSFHKATGKFSAKITLRGNQRHLGLFECPQEAHQAYAAAKASVHSFCPILREAVQ